MVSDPMLLITTELPPESCDESPLVQAVINNKPMITTDRKKCFIRVNYNLFRIH